MLKIIISFSLLFFPGFSSLAIDNDFFVSSFEKAHELYDQGVDHNFIEYAVELHDQISQRYPKSEISEITQSTDAVIEALKECVFSLNGAYGEHISKNQQEEFAQEMLRLFIKKGDLRLYKISRDPVLNIFPLGTTHCGLALRLDDLTVIFQGGPSD